MAEIVTGTPAIVGFTNGNDRGYGYRHGISDKDQMFATSIDAGERTRDVLEAIYASTVATEKTGAANALATEKIGAASLLAAEKIGAANVLATEKIGAASILSTERASLASQLGFKDAAMQLAECCCEIKKEIADVKATILSVDASRIRDDLNEARAELLAAKYAKNGNGNG